MYYVRLLTISVGYDSNDDDHTVVFLSLFNSFKKCEEESGKKLQYTQDTISYPDHHKTQSTVKRIERAERAKRTPTLKIVLKEWNIIQWINYKAASMFYDIFFSFPSSVCVCFISYL